MDALGSRQSSGLGPDYTPNQPHGSTLGNIGYSNRRDAELARTVHEQGHYDELINDVEKLRILKAGSLMSNCNANKSLYDYTDEKLLDRKDDLTRRIDRIYQNNTIVVPEQDINKQKHFEAHARLPGRSLQSKREALPPATAPSKDRGRLGEHSQLHHMRNRLSLQSGSLNESAKVPSQNCWTHTQTHVEQRRYRLQVRHLNEPGSLPIAEGTSRPESGMVLAKDYFDTAKKFQHPLRTILQNQEQHCQLESKTLLQIKDRYKNNNIYYWHDKARNEGRRA